MGSETDETKQNFAQFRALDTDIFGINPLGFVGSAGAHFAKV